MSDRIEIAIDGRVCTVAAGTSVAAALLDAGQPAFRASVQGEPRGPLCGMGICFECRVTINGVPHRRACMVTCEHGMSIATGAAPA
ncbi:MAG: (2Fe-2S)-binding protein [Gemmatimonadota bacterium]|nr:(2Fe-2S)-binding protein [Gemmatimonadota bacterium]MDE3128776.1 (2Fe-2S)-binding protein [Gemmatimonadota bacterium]MDE3172964.1 (2Fe-2S)-binding protein [Gemmatimonadota bacterium]MDE3216959.1 (2Fe-2S)-binding protein [Gemmatimonadota bacterium]